jgi:hypothetical protein
MARRSSEGFLDDEMMQELHADRLSGSPSDCESDTSSDDGGGGDDGDDDDDFGSSASQKCR